MFTSPTSAFLLRLAISTLACWFYTSLSAQDHQGYDPVDYFKKYALTNYPSFSADKPYYIVRTTKKLPAFMKTIRQLDEQTFIVATHDRQELNALGLKTSIAPANDQWKLSPVAERVFIKPSSKTQQYLITGFNADTLIKKLQGFSNEINILAIDKASQSVKINATQKFIEEKILPLPETRFVDIFVSPQTEINIVGYNRSFHGISMLDYTIPGANGKNIVAGVKEQKMESADLDLYKRVLSSPLAAATTSNHATVISSIIGGAGNSFYDGRGIASKCSFFSSSFDNLFADDAAILNTHKVLLQNHSYGTVIQQFYGAEAVSYDAETWQNKNRVHVFSAGNKGKEAATDGIYKNLPGFANLTGNFKMAKNIITIGAIDNKENIPAESSAGPLYDGRLAPQIVALGPNGTSDAAAIVSGTIAVMQQVFSDSNDGIFPPASLIKAVLFNTATDIYTKGIDYKTGFGLINSLEAVKSIQQKEYEGSSLAPSGQWTKTINIPVNAAQLKITLAWTDSTATVNNNKALVNDLDVELIEITTGKIYRPWVLSTFPNTDSLKKEPLRKRDSLNTVEQISIQLPAAGPYQVRVSSTTLLNAPLPFHIAWHIDTLNSFSFTSPQHTSDINRKENELLDIRWKTFTADTLETGNLYISYDEGSNWEVVHIAQRLITGLYRWPVKDTASKALLKMNTTFGDFYSNPFLISDVLQPRVSFLCQDSLGLVWQKHIYAKSYTIYALADSPYLKKIATVTDTTVNFRRQDHPYDVYAVEPVTENNIPAARSAAININYQGVGCFYKTFYHTLLDENKAELVLGLSSPGYTDSIFFEMVSPSGQLLQTSGSAKTNPTETVYRHLISETPQGTSYWRGRIKLKTGAIVYTNIIPLVSSGKRIILFYPNPVKRGNTFSFSIRQGTSFDTRLRIFDISGRPVLNFDERPDFINTGHLAAGIYIYKFSSGDKILETGRLVIMP